MQQVQGSLRAVSSGAEGSELSSEWGPESPVEP